MAGFANPAMIGVSRLKMQIGIIGANAQLSTNMLTYKGGSGPFESFSVAGQIYDHLKTGNLGSGLTGIFSKDRWGAVNDGSVKDFSTTAEVRGPFIMVNKNKLAFSIGYRLRGGLQLNNISAGVASLFFNGAGNLTPSNLHVPLNDLSFSASINAYHELYASFATQVWKSGSATLTAGLTVKYLSGMYSAAISNRGLSYTQESSDSIVTTQADLSYQYVDNPTFNVNPFTAKGIGAGLDAGLVYELYKDIDVAGIPFVAGKSPHLLRLGLSVIDVGRVFYSGSGVRSFDFRKVAQTVQWGSIDTLKVRGTANLDSTFNKVFGTRNSASSFSTGLPATINAFADVQIIPRVYLAGSITQSVTAVTGGGLKAFSALTLIPRFETALIEFALPIGLGLSYRSLQPGFMARVSGFYVGSDNLATLFGAGNRTGMSFYAGGYIPFGR